METDPGLISNYHFGTNREAAAGGAGPSAAPVKPI